MVIIDAVDSLVWPLYFGCFRILFGLDWRA
jgi:hypothetical protein